MAATPETQVVGQTTTSSNQQAQQNKQYSQELINKYGMSGLILSGAVPEGSKPSDVVVTSKEVGSVQPQISTQTSQVKAGNVYTPSEMQKQGLKPDSMVTVTSQTSNLVQPVKYNLGSNITAQQVAEFKAGAQSIDTTKQIQAAPTVQVQATPQTSNLVLRHYVDTTPQRVELTAQEAANFNYYPAQTGSTPQQVIAAIKVQQNKYASEYQVTHFPEKLQSATISGAEASRQQELTYKSTPESVAFRTIGSVGAQFVALPEGTPAGITSEVQKVTAPTTALLVIESGKAPIEIMSQRGTFGIEKIEPIVKTKIITTETTTGGKVGGVFGTLPEDVSTFTQASQAKVTTTYPYKIIGRTQTQTFDLVAGGTVRNLDNAQLGYLKNVIVYDEKGQTITNYQAFTASKILKEETLGGTKYIQSENQLVLLNPVSEGKYSLVGVQKTESLTAIPQASIETNTGVYGTYARLSASDTSRSVTTGKSIFYKNPQVEATFEKPSEPFDKTLLNIAKNINAEASGESKIIKVTNQGIETTTDVTTGGYRPPLISNEQILSNVNLPAAQASTTAKELTTIFSTSQIPKAISENIPKTETSAQIITTQKTPVKFVPITTPATSQIPTQTPKITTATIPVATSITTQQTETAQIQRIDTAAMPTAITIPAIAAIYARPPSMPAIPGLSSGSGSWSGSKKPTFFRQGFRMPSMKVKKGKKGLFPSLLQSGVSMLKFGKATPLKQSSANFAKYSGSQYIGVPTKQTAGKDLFSFKNVKFKIPKIKMKGFGR